MLAALPSWHRYRLGIVLCALSQNRGLGPLLVVHLLAQNRLGLHALEELLWQRLGRAFESLQTRNLPKRFALLPQLQRWIFGCWTSLLAGLSPHAQRRRRFLQKRQWIRQRCLLQGCGGADQLLPGLRSSNAVSDHPGARLEWCRHHAMARWRCYLGLFPWDSRSHARRQQGCQCVHCLCGASSNH